MAEMYIERFQQIETKINHFYHTDNIAKYDQTIFTVVIMPSKIFSINKEIMIFVQFPKLAVNHIKMFIAEIVGHGIDVFFFI